MTGIARPVLELLEYPKIVGWLAELTGAPTSAALARALAPSTDPARVQVGLVELVEGKRLAETRGPWPGPPPFALVAAVDGELRQGGVLPARALYQVAELLAAGARAAHYWSEARAEARTAARLADGLLSDPELEKRLRLSIDTDGLVLDGASAELASLRKQQNVERGRLREKLDKYRNLAAEEGSFVTQRSERFVVAVRADRFERSKGLVHDVSASGATLFVEPFEVCALNNALAELAARERSEIGRILRALTDLVRARLDGLARSEEALAATDLLWARVRLSRAMAGTTPTVVAGGDRLLLAGARHPLLWREARGDSDPPAGRAKVVPSTLELVSPRRILLVSGPNMGGKTVAMKVVGLCALLAQSGLDVPADEGATLPLFTTVGADIGDAQSIELHLSTFAAHLGRLDAMARTAGPQALFLVDEIGSGTDPAEGASLGRAMLRHFAKNGAWAVATTHLGSLKLLAQEEEAVVNASMALDPETLAPRYELIVGVPGGSHALAVAERLGFHPGVLAEARRELPEAARSLEALLGDVTRELAQARDARAGFERAEAEARSRAAELESERQAHVDDRKRADKERLLQVRALEGQVQALLRDVKSEARSEEKSRARIQELEVKARGLGRESDRLLATPAAGGRPALLAPGATGWVRDLGVTAKVVSGPDADGRVVLERGAWRIQSRADQCFAPDDPATAGSASSGPAPLARSAGRRAAAAIPEVEPGLSVDVRGLDQEDALRRVDDGLDRAVVSGLADLKIIHGVGRGVLREAIARALKANPHVAEQRLGGHGEGGRGVTIVSLR
ncbi:MAG: Smr/MutS family protein [Candidatus Eisenbacteria bacterium]